MKKFIVTRLILYFISLSSTALSNPLDTPMYSIGLLIDLHIPGQLGSHQQEMGKKAECGSLNVAAVQHVLAARWAAQVINNQSASQGIQLNIEIFDTCGMRDIAMRDVFFAIKDALDPREKQPLLGLIGLGDPDIVGETVTTLHAFNIPLVLASPRLAEMVMQQGNILTTAPDMSSVVKPVLAVGKQLGVSSMSIVSSCPHSIKKFGQTAMESGILIGRILQIAKQSKVIGDVVKTFLENAQFNETIALILEPEEIYTLAQHLRSFKLKKNVLLTGTIGLNKNLLKLWRNVFAGGYLIEPHMPELPDFRNYLLRILQAAQHNEDKLVHDYMEVVYNCQWITEKESDTPNCKNLKMNDIAGKLQIDPEVTFVVKAASAFSAAMFLVRVKQCPDRNLSDCTLLSNSNLQQDILAMLSQLSFTSQQKVPFELQGTSIHVTHDGQLVPNKYIIYHIHNSGEVNAVGWYSDDQGFVLNHSTVSALSLYPENTKKQGRGFEIDSFPKVAMREFFQTDSRVLSTLEDVAVKGVHISSSLENRKATEDEESGVNARRVTPESSLTRPWATVMVAMAAVGTFITMFMLVYVLIKICDGTLTGNQSLGVILLLGIITIYVSIVLFVLPASELKCTLRSFLYPIAMSLCYGILIIKVMQLRSLVLLGLGGRISYVNQYIILFFIVLVQVVINIQWFLTNRPQFRIDSEGASYCYMPRTDFLLLHLYVTILVVISFLYGLSVLKIRRNYKEGHWVTLAAFLTMPVLVIWGLVYSFVPERYEDPTICVALIILATVLVMALFIPKMGTISKQSSYFKHKKMQVSESVTTIFTTFTDLHNSSVTAARKKGASPSHKTQQLSASMLDAYSDNITKNPIYEVTNGAYP